MSQIFYSAEIRWFSDKRADLEQLLHSLPGIIIQEKERTDYYLKADLHATGIKIREGKHEIKTKCNPDEKHPLGAIEQWCKWSTPESNNILNTIDKSLREEWLPIQKERWQKKFDIQGVTPKAYTTGYPDNGCGVEFTALLIEGKKHYTFGLEAFSKDQSAIDNLLKMIDFLNLQKETLSAFKCMSYPEFIGTLGKD